MVHFLSLSLLRGTIAILTLVIIVYRIIPVLVASVQFFFAGLLGGYFFGGKITVRRRSIIEQFGP